MFISLQEIKDSLGSAYYKRGVEYNSQKRVLSMTKELFLDEENVEILNIHSSVRGSGRIYSQNIEIYFDYEYQLQNIVEGTCSCPVSYNCKHVAAVCIAHKADTDKGLLGKAASVSSVDKWLQDMHNTQLQKSESTKLKSDNFLTYRLDGVKSSLAGKLQFYKSKFLKNGKISRGAALNIERISNTYSYSELKNKDDENIIKMANVFVPNNYYNSTMEALSGSLGYLLVKEVLATQRCYFDHNPEPLTLVDETFNVKFEFKLYKGEYTLKSNLRNKEYKIIETSPLFLLNTDKNTMQELDIEIQTYKQMSEAPKFFKDDIAKVYTRVIDTLPDINVITPKVIKVQKIKVTPRARIYLSSNSFLIDFLYEDFLVKFYPRKDIDNKIVNYEKVEIQRDLEFELLAKEKIDSLGFFLEEINSNLVAKFKGTNRQKELQVWKEFLNSEVDKLKSEGWLIEEDETFNMKFEPSSEIVVESEDKNDWFSLSFNLEFNGVSQPIAPLVSGIITEFDNFENMPELLHVEVEPNHFVEVQSRQIKPILNTIIELVDKKDKDENLKISSFDAHLLDFMDDDILWKGSQEILALSQKLKDFKGIKKVEPPKCLNATLREYQQDGLNWLNFLYEFKFGGILADDMGLGKTIQTLAHLSRLKEKNLLVKPSLIVMPTSLIANWKNEAKKFTPNLKVLSLHGSDRFQEFDKIEEHDILLTTYPLIVRDKKRFDEFDFMYIILDEAQKIKNHQTKMSVALKTYKSEYRLALSGTPIENHLGELWSIFSFLMPGFLDTISFFKNYYQTPIEKEHNMQRQNLLNKRIKPFMIRRTKEIVADELPAKSEIIKYTQFNDKQSKLYESIRITMEKKVQDAVSTKGLGSSHITILDALLKLRQVCCDPSLLKIQEAQKVQESAKLELFLDLIDELLQENRKILVFSQFTSMLAIIEEKLVSKKISYTLLTGSTRKREEEIEKFTRGEADIFLISLKAGGVGLNLVEADTVIHYDPWWNPAVENQATDRAHRIGQKKAVFVYKLIVENTIEQKILEMQKKKQALQDAIYDSDKQQDDIKFSGIELLDLLK
ncbi:DEAD/DEAH box helicase [Sulfurimonas sp.]|jgi:SNF2 family DNA or RNA helicase|uniref:DEAD/DEAH box helicase n=1 Tax=Sulfurimonas sp. TaxID=2022749 RepID=UPI0025EC6596|nr:DEAD/DEAH box helicase [Sulfurimonas sp.]MBT5934747.1 DEAD/DEAH box helicase family protein [Sulfurimonas sp.]